LSARLSPPPLWKADAPNGAKRRGDYDIADFAAIIVRGSTNKPRKPTMTQPELYERFRDLHARPDGFIMPNAWDGTSALLLREAGFLAIGTSSAAIAAALGRIDGRHAVSLQEHLANAQLLGSLTNLPINGDFEDGYGTTPSDVAATVQAAIAGGLAGIGIEDTSGDPAHPIRDFDDAVARIRAAAAVAKGRILLTGRTDNYLQGRPDLDDTIRRLTAFAEAGADVLYAPYPPGMAEVVAIVKAVAPKPVNLVVGPKSGPLPAAELFKAGVKRISMGVGLYTRVMGDLRQAAQELAAGDIAAATNNKGLPFGAIVKLIASA
jgi:2-methylisocitrate lyase-like PEP mutase family enzyme